MKIIEILILGDRSKQRFFVRIVDSAAENIDQRFLLEHRNVEANCQLALQRKIYLKNAIICVSKCKDRPGLWSARYAS